MSRLDHLEFNPDLIFTFLLSRPANGECYGMGVRAALSSRRLRLQPSFDALPRPNSWASP
jgi:hypothetical protein